MSDPLRPTRTRGARTRRFPWWLLLVAFVVVPLVEIYVIVQIGQVIGAWWTILLLVADSLLGSWLVKREGGRAWEALRVALQQGRMPHKELADGMLVLIGGLLMLTPGFVLDVVGLLAILPVTRPLGRRALAGVIARRLTSSGGPGMGFPVAGFGGFPGGAAGGPASQGRARRSPGPDDVVPGEVVD
ncbi:UPF0716 protein FxsA [Nocardioides scoriae]|uniref:UPF0716 protein FxsA n=1 Tax=Nocardioides scoriae TaxID=642780 RepID=A0A1H1NM04_9ACTN|nr:FxsA family protein [Nocardioides scoriae]SDS00022.1 UPF0716 protein FxsA [Nocardioides scoriae]